MHLHYDDIGRALRCSLCCTPTLRGQRLMALKRILLSQYLCVGLNAERMELVWDFFLRPWFRQTHVGADGTRRSEREMRRFGHVLQHSPKDGEAWQIRGPFEVHGPSPHPDFPHLRRETWLRSTEASLTESLGFTFPVTHTLDGGRALGKCLGHIKPSVKVNSLDASLC